MNESGLARVFRLGWYPFALFGSLAIAYTLIAAGAPPEAAAGGVPLVLMPLSLALEFAFPETPRWRTHAAQGVAVAAGETG